jgi:hypothetical protein
LLVLCCADGRYDIAGSDEEHGRSRRHGAEDRGWSSIGRVLGDWTIESRVMLCAVCTVHEEHRFIG